MRKAIVGVAVLLMALATVACGVASSNSTPTPSPSPTVPGGVRQEATGVPFKIKGGESVELAGLYGVLTFVGVTEDSRCPSDVQCVWAGEAKVALRWTTQEGPQDFEVTIDASGSASHAVDGVTIEVSNLTPYPVSTAPTPTTGEYELTVVVRVGE